MKSFAQWVAGAVLLTGFAIPPAIAQPAPAMYGPETPAFTPPLPEMRYVTVPEKYRAAFEGNRLSYMQAGKPEAPALVMLHGIGANATHWRFQYAALQDSYRLIGWNAPGYMLSDNLKADAPGCDDYANAVAALLDALKLERAYVLGNSFGSAVAQCFAMAYPQRVLKLALTGMIIGAANLPEADKAAAIKGREASIAGGGMTLGLSGRDTVLLGSKTDPGLRPMLQSVLSATNPRGYFQAMHFILGLQPTPQSAGRLTMPVLMIQGTEDRIAVMERNAALLKAALPSAELMLLEGYGHLPEFEQPAAVNARLRQFFRP
jgi:pimeloyl-ACP methyl ester carboxylesterase